MRKGYGIVLPREKYKAPSDPLERERTRRKIEPATGYLTQVVRRMANDLQRRRTDRLSGAALTNDELMVNQAAAAAILSDLEREHFTNAAKVQFQKDFWLWLMGKSNKQSDIDRTQWGAQPCYDDPEVRAYLAEFIAKRKEFKLKLAMLQTRPPRGIDQYYLYFKYIVRGNYGDRNPDDELSFLEDWDRFVRAFDESPDEHPLDPAHPVWPKPYASNRESATWIEEGPDATPPQFADQRGVLMTPGKYATPIQEFELAPPIVDADEDEQDREQSEEADAEEEAAQQDDPEKRVLDFQDPVDPMSPRPEPSPQQAELARRYSALKDAAADLAESITSTDSGTDASYQPESYSVSDETEGGSSGSGSGTAEVIAEEQVVEKPRERKQVEQYDPAEQIEKDRIREERLKQLQKEHLPNVAKSAWRLHETFKRKQVRMPEELQEFLEALDFETQTQEQLLMQIEAKVGQLIEEDDDEDEDLVLLELDVGRRLREIRRKKKSE